MKLFKLPDLGEGLPDAIIREWYVKPGDTIKAEQALVAMETAKALVDVPAPFAGEVEKLFGEVGDTIETGNPLIGFVSDGEEAPSAKDAGTVVGSIETSSTVLQAPAAGLSASSGSSSDRTRVSPALRALARRLGVDLANVTPAGERITKKDIEQAAAGAGTSQPQPGFETLTPARKAMVMSMTQSHAEIVPVTIMDDADLHLWEGQQDFTVRLIRAMAAACEAEPMLNASFDGPNLSYQLNSSINIGLAIDTPQGLFVPVIKDTNHLSNDVIRQKINVLKTQAQEKSIAPDDLHGATIMLSNFGTVAGRYANPILVKPMVAILGVGKLREEVVAEDGNIAIHPRLPLSLTVDHRLVTGGEAARFLSAVMHHISQPS